MSNSLSGLRNILVHGYATVNKDIVLDAAKKIKEDATRITKSIMDNARNIITDPSPPNQLIERIRTI